MTAAGCGCCRDYGPAHNRYPCIACGHTSDEQEEAALARLQASAAAANVDPPPAEIGEWMAAELGQAPDGPEGDDR